MGTCRRCSWLCCECAGPRREGWGLGATGLGGLGLPQGAGRGGGGVWEGVGLSVGGARVPCWVGPLTQLP